MRRHPATAFPVIFLAVCALCAFPAAPSAAADKTVGYLTVPVPVETGTTIPCAVWYPAAGGTAHVHYGTERAARVGTAFEDAHPDPGRGPCPLVIYSHGYSGCSTASAYLCEALAVDGFIVAAPDHTDDLKICSLAPGYNPKPLTGMKILFSVFRLSDRLSSGEYDIEEFRYRLVQIKAAIDYLTAQGRDPLSPFFGTVDAGRIGAVGHSLGGFSVMVAAGARDVGIDFGIGAVVCLSGPGGKVFSCEDMKRIAVPVMLMYGQNEERSREKGSGLTNQYRCLSTPKFLIGLVGGDHLSFSERLYSDAAPDTASARAIDAQHRLIARRTTAFFRYYLTNAADAAAILAGDDPGLAPNYRSF